METLILERVGRNFDGYTAYKDEKGNYYLDTSHFVEANPKELYTAHPRNDIDGEPGFPIKRPFVITNPCTEIELKEAQYKKEYMMLGRIYDDMTAFFGKTGNEEDNQMDCRYHNEKRLWGDTIEETLAELKKWYDAIPKDIKPEWCTAEDIKKLERRAEEYKTILSK